jgi:ketosteroid isomerase-like protein
MNTRSITKIFLGGLLICLGPRLQAQPQVQTAESISEFCAEPSCDARTRELETRLRAFLDTLADALSTGDVDRLSAFFTDESSIFYPSAPFALGRVDGREAIEEAWLLGLAAGRRPTSSGGAQGSESAVVTAPTALRIEPQNLKAQVFGDIALVTFELGPPDGPGRARRTIVWRRDAGDWSVLHLHASALGL